MFSWTEKTVQQALCSLKGFVPFTRYICIPNVRSGIAVYTGESDLIAVSKVGYVKEFEIKISVSDLKKDKEKVKHRLWELPGNSVSEFWYAIPDEIALKVDVSEHIPAYAGILTVHKSNKGFYCRVIRKAVRKKNARKLTDKEMLSIARLGCIRLWTLKKDTQK